MDPRTAISLARGGKLRLLWKLTRGFDAFYRVSFVAAAASSGLLALLRGGPRTFERLAADLAPEPATQAALLAWLGLGVELGELDQGPDGYRLEGDLSRALAAGENDDVAALVVEVARFHHRLILDTPGRLARGESFRPEEIDGRVIARSSRILEPFLFEAMDRMLHVDMPVRLLDVGCGAGTCLRHAAARSPGLTAVGIERDPAVAADTREAIRRWGLEHRISVETGDVRERPGDESFDVVTLHNAIYYFPFAERVALLGQLSSFLKAGGRLLVTTSCRGGSPGMRVLDLWTSSTVGFGPLPAPDELAGQMREAGLVEIEVRRAIPGEQYFALTARRRRAPEPAS